MCAAVAHGMGGSVALVLHGGICKQGPMFWFGAHHLDALLAHRPLLGTILAKVFCDV